MSNITIAFQGELGAYSEQAITQINPGATAIPCKSFEDVFTALSSEAVTYALIPIENSIVGLVANRHQLWPKNDIYIIGEHFEPIHHQLLAPQGATLEGITDVYSHVHALGQCRDFIRTHSLAANVHADTAGAALDVSKWNDPTRAAIASSLSAKRYGLAILAEDIEDATHNTTRFLLLSRVSSVPPVDSDVITTIIFTLRSVPAALYKAIGGFATSGINLSKIESYLSGEHFSLAQFYIDVEGHPESKNMKHAMEELRYFSNEVRILGTYPAHSFRRN